MDGGNAFQKLIFGKLILVYFDNQKKYWEKSFNLAEKVFNSIEILDKNIRDLIDKSYPNIKKELMSIVFSKNCQYFTLRYITRVSSSPIINEDKIKINYFIEFNQDLTMRYEIKYYDMEKINGKKIN